MSQNNMISFLTLNDLDSNIVELNPAAILLMQRINTETIPYTKLTLSFNVAICVTQTPEEIAQLQMDSVSKVMESVMVMTKNIIESMEQEW